MATRKERLSGFSVGRVPPTNQLLEVLCEDNSGTYALPFACHWTNGTWLNSGSGVAILGTVIGWRPWSRAEPTS
jgi:hypothetical protein